jgi:hypothetical protein
MLVELDLQNAVCDTTLAWLMEKYPHLPVVDGEGLKGLPEYILDQTTPRNQTRNIQAMIDGKYLSVASTAQAHMMTGTPRGAAMAVAVYISYPDREARDDAAEMQLHSEYMVAETPGELVEKLKGLAGRFDIDRRKFDIALEFAEDGTLSIAARDALDRGNRSNIIRTVFASGENDALEYFAATVKNRDSNFAALLNHPMDQPSIPVRR